jgi:hypothetical protein
MKWTKAHSRNAVAAKARKRMQQTFDDVDRTQQRRVPVPRKRRATITIQIRDREIGDSLTLNLHRSPWPNHWLCEQGQYSTAQIGEALKHMLDSAARRATTAPYQHA